VNGGQLHRLGRRLIELSREVTGEPGDPALTPGEAAVLDNAIFHPGSSVSEISERSGFAQSHVSVSVARLRERGLITTEADPADGRRTRVRATEVTVKAIVRRAGRGVDDAIRHAVDGPDEARRVTALLDELAHLLLP
jgi:DNA-binding MarR family transcriptional regulator